jgi:phenylpropionate dioxygenase-like ring-hydroxylating dioxygenase large terminal subunit
MKFKNSSIPNILTHKDTFKNYNFYGSSQYIVNNQFNYFLNKCPHRGNQIIQPGSTKNNLQCGLHGWEWKQDGSPVNNNINLVKKTATLGESGLIFVNWDEPKTAIWAQELKKDNFVYSHNKVKKGTGDWRWQMEMHVDLLHVPFIHKSLNEYVDVKNLQTEYGKDWIAQHHAHGWWLFVYPFTHIEYEKGCLYISEISPNNNWNGYDVFIHYLFNSSIDTNIKKNFIEMAEITFDEDLNAVNNLSKNNIYRKPNKNLHDLEKDILHFYNWVEKNVE